jgi:hypothetical protein
VLYQRHSTDQGRGISRVSPQPIRLSGSPDSSASICGSSF